MYSFKDQVVIVTGAAGGIGSGVAKIFASAGARVVVNDKDFAGAQEVAQEIAAAGGMARADGTDITSSDAVDEMVAKTVSDWGGVQVLINNAGIIRDHRIQKMSNAEWDSVVDLCLKGSFYCARAVVPTMLEALYGRIINISSMAYKGNIGQVNYVSAKAGIVGMTKALGLELAQRGITVNCISPGLIQTPNLLKFDKDLVEKLVAGTPVGRAGEPSDIANAAMFFAAQESGFVTRQILHVSGGNEGW